MRWLERRARESWEVEKEVVREVWGEEGSFVEEGWDWLGCIDEDNDEEEDALFCTLPPPPPALLLALLLVNEGKGLEGEVGADKPSPLSKQ